MKTLIHLTVRAFVHSQIAWMVHSFFFFKLQTNFVQPWFSTAFDIFITLLEFKKLRGLPWWSSG